MVTEKGREIGIGELGELSVTAVSGLGNEVKGLVLEEWVVKAVRISLQHNSPTSSIKLTIPSFPTDLTAFLFHRDLKILFSTPNPAHRTS